MKKLLALLMATATALTVNVLSFAQSTDNKDLFLGENEDGIVLTDETILTPSNTYKFPIMLTKDGKEIQLNNEIAKDYSIRFEAIKGRTALDYFKLTRENDKHFVEMKVKSGWPNTQTNVEYNLKLIKKGDASNTIENEIKFKTGYKTVSDDYINSLTEGEYITVSPETPIFTKKQMEKIAEINNYKKVTFTDGNWTYTVNITDMDAVNMLFNSYAIRPILEKFSNNDFKFLTFPAGTSFMRGDLTIDVSDIVEDFDGKFYTYRYYKGVLTKVENSFNADDNTITMAVSDLGRFVITDKEIADKTVVEEGFGGSDNNSKPNEKPNTPNIPKPEKPNPETGANSLSLIMAMAAMVSVFSATSIAKKLNK